MFQAIFQVIRYELREDNSIRDAIFHDHKERWHRSERAADSFAEKLGRLALSHRSRVSLEWDGPWYEGENKRDTLVFRRKRDGALLGEVRVLYGKGWDK